MKILFSLNSSAPGGMERHVLDLVNGLVKKNHEIFVWCPQGTMSDLYRDAGATVINIDVRVTFGIDIDPTYIVALVKFLKQSKIDVVHCHELRAVGNSLLAGFFARTRVRVSHIHTPFTHWPIPKWKKKLYSFFYSIAIFLLSSKEIALTESIKRIKISEGIPSQKISIIPNAIEINKFDLDWETKKRYRNNILSKFNVSKEKFVFGIISRMTEEKGHALLIDAFGKLLEFSSVDKSLVHLLLAGGGALESSLKNQIEQLNLTDNVSISGIFEEDEKVEFLAAFDLFVFPSYAEGFGISLIEAMGAGLAVLCSDLEVFQEVGDGTVLFFEKGNVDDLAEKLHGAFLRRDNLENLREGAFERVKKLYTMDKFINEYENLYFDLAGRV